MIDWHTNDLDNRMYCNIEGGRKIAMPRYYKLRIYTKEQLGYLKGVNEQKAEQRLIESQRLGTLEKAAIAKQKLDVAFKRMNRNNDKIKI